MATAFTVGDADHAFDSSSARGRLLAIHFLLPTDCPYCLQQIREYAQNAATLAGVQQIFVNAQPKKEFQEWLKSVDNAQALPIYRDESGKLGKQFRIPDGYAFHGSVMNYPALVLLDADGKEVFRHIGTDNRDRYPFAAFASKVDELTRDSETANANLADKRGIQGYDPVEYLDNMKAIEGQKAITSAYRGVTYQFASLSNRDKFNASPSKFVPAYGGWCATAMAEGRKVEIDPKNFKIVNGRLLLFYKSFFADALKDWNKNETELFPKADAAWDKIIATK